MAQALAHGHRITRVYDVDAFFPYQILSVYSPYKFEYYIAVDWTYSPSSHTLFINNQFIIMDPHAIPGPSHQRVTSMDPTVITSSESGVSLPWHHTADSVLLQYSIERKVHPLRLEVTFRRPTSNILIYEVFVASASIQTLKKSTPLLTVIFNDEASSSVLPTFLLPIGQSSTSPSKTFRIRHALLSVLAPIAFVALFAVDGVIVLFKFVLLVTLLWFAGAIVGDSVKRNGWSVLKKKTHLSYPEGKWMPGSALATIREEDVEEELGEKVEEEVSEVITRSEDIV